MSCAQAYGRPRGVVNADLKGTPSEHYIKVQGHVIVQGEQWVAADVEGSDIPVFSEPLTIDELEDARDTFTRSFGLASSSNTDGYVQYIKWSCACTMSESSKPSP
jgi:hypothetical protein